jgi:type IV secretion system protein VirD4
MKLNTFQIILIVIMALLPTYFLSGLIALVLNGIKAKELLYYYNYETTYYALLQNHPNIYTLFIGLFLFFCLLFLLIALSFRVKEKLHGDAKWANKSDMKKIGLFGDEGIIIGKYKEDLLRLSIPTAISLSAVTRQGKGVSNVIPNLLEWKESLIVTDIKNENFVKTSKYRQKVLGQKVYHYNPFSYNTAKFNPLFYVDKENSDKAQLDLIDIAMSLYPPISNEPNEKFFEDNARNLFIGVCMLFMDMQESSHSNELLNDNGVKFNLPGILDLAQNFTIPYEDDEDENAPDITDFKEIVEYLKSYSIVKKTTQEKLNSYLNISAENTQSGVWSSFITPLLQFDNPILRHALSDNDFDLRNIRKEKMTIYIGITPDNLNKAKTLLNLFWSYFITLNTKELPEHNPELKYKVMMMMDELPAMGYLESLRFSIGFMLGYALRPVLIYQTKAQLKKEIKEGGYGKNGTDEMLDNVQANIYFALINLDEAKKLSEQLGYKTVKQKSRSYNSGKGLEFGTGGQNVSEAKRALLLPQEIMQLNKDKQIITLLAQKPILCNKSYYYNDEYFLRKIGTVSPTLRAIMNKKKWFLFNNLPSEKDFKKIDIETSIKPFTAFTQIVKGEEVTVYEFQEKGMIA